MTPITITLEQLRNMIGVELIHQSVSCKVVEVLEDGPSIVLESLDEGHIQSDQYGNPLRRVPQTFNVPVLSRDKKNIHPAFLALDLLS